MAKFKNKNGGVCVVYTSTNIERLRRNPEYTEIIEIEQNEEKKSPKTAKKTKKLEEVAEDKPLQ